nr:immunoglobulin light chain junction region [Macaca mulatta]
DYHCFSTESSGNHWLF